MTSFRTRLNRANLSGHPEKDVVGEKHYIEDAEMLYEHIEGVLAEVRLVVLDEDLHEWQCIYRGMW